MFGDELIPAQGWYIRFDAGFSSATDPDVEIPSGSIPADLGSSPVFGGGFGLKYVPGLRGDVSVTYRSGFEHVSGFAGMPQGNAEFRSLVTLLSLYLDLLATERVSPYGGFGIGFSKNKLEQITITNPDGSLLGTIQGKSHSNFAYQLCAGVNFQLAERFLLDAGYRFVKAGDYESADLLVFPDGSNAPGKTIGKLSSHEVILSLQYVF